MAESAWEPKVRWRWLCGYLLGQNMTSDLVISNSALVLPNSNCATTRSVHTPSRNHQQLDPTTEVQMETEEEVENLEEEVDPINLYKGE
ncbi:hypothetical protein Sjap_005296 [Stephania japonica]|uniref:Uncharacterized protein n=1 Tax=Stephania japonica TaxID=461633 RepID=A0AAP0K3S4_9MAGN